MSVAIGTRLGPYEITDLLGVGGMGEVYRARDERLHRDVALKVLPDAVSTDPDRVARFEREARALAALNHPNIAQIFDVAAIAGAPGATATHALVMELVPGETLAARLRARGALPLREALDLARQIAAAIEAAHDRGIVHRDLKPANIRIRDDGAVKVLDFGLAKALSDERPLSDSAIAVSPTRSHHETELGLVVGTAAYMAPEQATGRPVDRRTDIWAFGVVCVEMLTGRRLFQGETSAALIADVLKGDIDWTLLPVKTPATVVRLLQRCLERDLPRRLRDIGDARLEIEDALSAASSGATTAAAVPPAPPAAFTRERRVWIAALAAVVVAAAAIVWLRSPGPAPAAPEVRFEIVTPPASAAITSALALALSPDGRSVVFPGTVAGQSQLFIRPFDAEDARALSGSAELTSLLQWSDDGRTLVGDGSVPGGLVRYDAATGATTPIVNVRVGFGWTINADGVILTALGNTAPLVKETTAGAAPVPVTRLEAPQVGHRFPYFLPDGRHFIFLATGPPETQGIFLGSLDSTSSRRLVAADTQAVFAPPNLVVFGREDTLLAQPLDMATFEPAGQPFPVASSVLQLRDIFGIAAVAASRSGAIAFRHAALPLHQLVWMDRSGKTVGTVGEADRIEAVSAPQLSPDGRTVAISRRVNGNTDIWTIENSPGALYQRVTTNPAADWVGAWSPDGRQVVFFSSRRGGGTYDLYTRAVDGADDVPLLVSNDNTALGDWSRDGRFVLYTFQGHAAVQRDIWAIPIQGDRKPFPVSADPSDEVGARFSPDGHWIAYQVNEADKADVYVRPFPGPGRAWRISTNGGRSPQWSRGGKEIDYRGADGAVMAVEVTLSADRVERSAPTKLFSLRAGSTFAVQPDGERFLVDARLEDPRTPPVTVIVNLAVRTP